MGPKYRLFQINLGGYTVRPAVPSNTGHLTQAAYVTVNFLAATLKKEKLILVILTQIGGFPGGSNGKESACNAGHPDLLFGFGSSPGEGNGYPLQYTCLENSLDRGVWWATVHGVTKSRI